MRQKLCFLLIFNIGIVLTATPQEESSGFLFSEFKEAQVYIAGTYSNEKVNYNVLDKQLYYVDQRDGLVRIVDDMSRIKIIRVDNRNFIPVSSGGIQEALPTTPSIFVEYLPRVKRKAQQVAYGGTSEITSTTPSTYMLARDGFILPEKSDLEATSVYNCYWIEKNGKKKKFANFKQLMKIYPANKTILDEYIEKNNVDFNNKEEIVKLCLYAESLN